MVIQPALVLVHCPTSSVLDAVICCAYCLLAFAFTWNGFGSFLFVPFFHPNTRTYFQWIRFEFYSSLKTERLALIQCWSSTFKLGICTGLHRDVDPALILEAELPRALWKSSQNSSTGTVQETYTLSSVPVTVREIAIGPILVRTFIYF